MHIHDMSRCDLLSLRLHHGSCLSTPKIENEKQYIYKRFEFIENDWEQHELDVHTHIP